ncbi:MAG: hypothetical protein SXQ77_03705, partial [Halobacteria archaeon]|nr:hypothetical protein [Halobacteria archaeon]
MKDAQSNSNSNESDNENSNSGQKSESRNAKDTKREESGKHPPGMYPVDMPEVGTKDAPPGTIGHDYLPEVDDGESQVSVPVQRT